MLDFIYRKAVFKDCFFVCKPVVEDVLPTYDYSCDSCGSKFELRLKFSDEVDQPCPMEGCNATAKRQFSAVPIVFKGSGWYVNDYGKKASSSGKASDSVSNDKDTASSDSTSQSPEKSSSKDSKDAATSPKKESTSTSSTKSTSSD